MKKPKPLPVPTPDRAAIITAICSLQIERHNLLARTWAYNLDYGTVRTLSMIAQTCSNKATEIDAVIRFLETYL